VPAAQGLPIYACSPTSIGEADAHRIYAQGQARAYTTVADFGNIHPYPNGRHPETTGWGGQDPEGDYRYGALGYNMQGIGEAVMQAGVAMSATENGYRYVFPYAGGQRSVTDEVGGIYTSRMAMHTFGYRLPSGASNRKNFLYLLYDDENAGFGLVRSDGTVRPAYTALQNLIALLADPGQSFTPGGLDYQLSGSLNDVKTLLLQQRSSVFYLGLWLGKSVWDPDGAFAINVPNQTVTVTLPATAGAVAQNFPSDNQSWVNVPKSGNQVTIDVGAKAMLLRITPT
jgi:hypothetical protein